MDKKIQELDKFSRVEAIAKEDLFNTPNY